MTRSLDDAVVVITGASSGIGRGAALEFAKKGSNLVLAARRTDALETLAADCEKLGGRAVAVPTDVTDESQVQALADRAIESFGRIDVWVNNAAVSAFGPFEETPPDVFRRVVETNFFGYVHGARAAVRRFREQGEGVLINTASMVGKAGAAYLAAYTSTKFAILGFSESLRQELIDEPDIHVSTILPASIDTPLFQQAANYAGRAVKPLDPTYDATLVARAIVKAATTPKKEILVGDAGALVALTRRIAPRLYDRVAAKQVRTDHFSDVPAPPSRGNLFEPMPQYTGVSGGWGGHAPGIPGTILPAFLRMVVLSILVLLVTRAVSDRATSASGPRRFLPRR
jgi:short-subunit dehydrogenase